MEHGEVKLSLDHYNRLRDFEKNIQSNKTVKVNTYWEKDMNLYAEWYYSQSEMVERIGRKNLKLSDRILDLEKQLSGEPKEIMLKDVRKMSIWQFIKWRKE